MSLPFRCIHFDDLSIFLNNSKCVESVESILFIHISRKIQNDESLSNCFAFANHFRYHYPHCEQYAQSKNPICSGRRIEFPFLLLATVIFIVGCSRRATSKSGMILKRRKIFHNNVYFEPPYFCSALAILYDFNGVSCCSDYTHTPKAMRILMNEDNLRHVTLKMGAADLSSEWASETDSVATSASAGKCWWNWMTMTPLIHGHSRRCKQVPSDH